MWLSDQMCRRLGIALVTSGAVVLAACCTQYVVGMRFFAEPPVFPALGIVIVGASLLATAWAGEN